MTSTRIQQLKIGPFPQRFDPWAENGRYFHPLHGQMMGNLLNTLGDDLLECGYLIGRETSLQIAQGGYPDLFIRAETSKAAPPRPCPM